MTISRANIAAYLDTQFSSLAAAVDQDSDPDIGYSPDIDNALRLLGTTESNLATATVVDGLRDAVFAIAEYYAARRFWRQLTSRVNTETGETSYDFKDQLKNAKLLMDDAADAAALLGYIVDGRKVRALFRVY